MILPPRPNQIQRGIHGGTAQIACLILDRVPFLAPDEAQKDGLQHIFGVGRIAGDPVCGTEDQRVVRLKGAREFAA